MSKSNNHYVTPNIPSAGLAGRNLTANKNRSKATASSRSSNTDYINYTALDTFHRETVFKAEEAQRTWNAKYAPWLINEYRQMYESISRNRGVPLDNRVPSLKRPEWQQPLERLPLVRKRLPGQRRRRILGSFPETENDKIGWRLLPEHAIDIYGSQLANIPPLPKQYKFSSWPVESFH